MPTQTLLWLNQVYNSDYTGSVVWDLFCKEQEMLENSYSLAVRLMLGLPRNTHRYFIEPLSERSHIKSDLIERFLSFLEKIRRSKKTTLVYVLETVCSDMHSVTANNLHNIKLRSGKDTTETITASESKVAFKEIPNGQEWRINFAREIIDVEHDKLEVPGFVTEELKSILTWICTTGPS